MVLICTLEVNSHIVEISHEIKRLADRSGILRICEESVDEILSLDLGVHILSKALPPECICTLDIFLLVSRNAASLNCEWIQRLDILDCSLLVDIQLVILLHERLTE